jgi:hypothetical protein
MRRSGHHRQREHSCQGQRRGDWSLCRNRYKATYQDNGSSKTIYGETQTEVLSALETRGIVEFAVSSASLEDLYLELTGHNPGVENGV